MLMLIPLFLNEGEQGYWYTFGSMAALLVLADLGFTQILLNFSSHEFSKLKMGEHHLLEGDVYDISTIGSLYRFAMQWAGAIALIGLPIVSFTGYALLARDAQSEEIMWLIPWLIYSVSSSIIFFTNFTLSFVEGLEQVGNIQKIRARTSMVSFGVSVSFLASGLGLYSLALGSITNALICTFWTFIKYRFVLRQMLSHSRSQEGNWSKEIFPLLSRYAVSWVGGGLASSMLIPTAFFFHGAKIAGQVGLSIALYTAIIGISGTWITVILPKMNILIARGDRSELRNMFAMHFKLTIATYILGCMGVFFLLVLLSDVFEFVDRLVSTPSLILLMVGCLMHSALGPIAIFLRAHKKEPLMVMSLVMGCIVSISTVLAGKYLIDDFYFVGYTFGSVIALLWTLTIFRKYWGIEVE